MQLSEDRMAVFYSFVVQFTSVKKSYKKEGNLKKKSKFSSCSFDTLLI